MGDRANRAREWCRCIYGPYCLEAGGISADTINRKSGGQLTTRRNSWPKIDNIFKESRAEAVSLYEFRIDGSIMTMTSLPSGQ